MVNLWLRLRENRTSRFLRPAGTRPKDFEKSLLFNAAIAIMTRKGGGGRRCAPHRPRPFRIASWHHIRPQNRRAVVLAVRFCSF
jgi:hypothetical protein